MADTAYPYTRKGSTRRTASSHIPVSISRIKKDEANRQRNFTAPEQSRLLLMQIKYQERLLEEKEAKLINMYQKNQGMALGRIGGLGSGGRKQGIVRDFFKERREIETSKQGFVLDRTDHFQEKKRHSLKGEQVRREEEKERQLHNMRRVKSERQLSEKQIHGVNRSKPLAPIMKNYSQSMKDVQHSRDWPHEATDYGRFYRTDKTQFQQQHSSRNEQSTISHHHNFTTANSSMKAQDSADSDDNEDQRFHMTNKSTKTKVRKHRVKQRWVATGDTSYMNSDPLESDEFKEVAKQRHTEVKQQTRLMKPKKTRVKSKPDWTSITTSSDENYTNEDPNFPPATQTKGHNKARRTSDFQKGQLKQELERADQLEKYHNGLNTPERCNQFDQREGKALQLRRKEEIDEMEYQKQMMKELEAQIARKQLDLSRLIEQPELRQSQSKSQDQRANHAKHVSTRYNRDEPNLTYLSESDDGGSLVSSSTIVLTKPVRVTPRDNPKTKKLQQKQAISPIPPKYETPPAKYETPRLSANNPGVEYYARVAEESDEAGKHLNLTECPICGRRFNQERLAKHTKVCQKVAKKKPRKVFDMRKKRFEGTANAEYVNREQHSPDQRTKKKSNWRESHNELVNAVRDARRVQNHLAKGGNIRDLPPPAPAQHSDYKQCPHCQRRFNPTVADRHIPKCKNIKSRPAPPRKGDRL